MGSAMRSPRRSPFFAGCVLLGVVAVLPGSLPAGAKDSDNSVSRVVHALEARYRNAESFRAIFLERRSEGRGSMQLESGTLYLRRPGWMRWEYESPEKKLFLVDGKFAWFYVPADRTVTKAPVRQSDDERIPLLLLAGKTNLSRVCRRIELADVHVEAPGNVALRCMPAHGAEQDYKEAVFEVDAESHLVRLLVEEAGGIETEFHFANWQENLPLDRSLFQFVPPKGIAVVDERSLMGSPGAN